MSTGETTWRQRLSARATSILTLRVNEMDVEIDRIADGDELVVVPSTKGHRLLSLLDGSSRPVTDDEVLLCATSVPYRHRFDVVGASDVVGFGDTRSRMVRESCDVDGRPTDTAPGWPASSPAQSMLVRACGSLPGSPGSRRTSCPEVSCP